MDEKRNDDQPIAEATDEQSMTRRDALKVAGVLAALGAGLGVLAEPAAGEPGDALRVTLKFYRAGSESGGGPVEVARCSWDWGNSVTRGVMSVPKGQLQMKWFMDDAPAVGRETRTPRQVLVHSQTIALDSSDAMARLRSAGLIK